MNIKVLIRYADFEDYNFFENPLKTFEPGNIIIALFPKKETTYMKDQVVGYRSENQYGETKSMAEVAFLVGDVNCNLGSCDCCKMFEKSDIVKIGKVDFGKINE